ncbi:MAG: hypothetical protein WEB29_06295 [Chloroflexota bacterium]
MVGQQGAATALKGAIRPEDLGDPPSVGGEDSLAASAERRGERHGPVIGGGGKARQPAEQSPGLNDGVGRWAVRSVNALHAALAIRTEHHASVRGDHGQPMKSAPPFAGVGDGRDGSVVRGEDAADATDAMGAEGYPACLVDRRAQWADRRELAVGRGEAMEGLRAEQVNAIDAILVTPVEGRVAGIVEVRMARHPGQRRPCRLRFGSATPDEDSHGAIVQCRLERDHASLVDRGDVRGEVGELTARHGDHRLREHEQA